MGDIPPPCQIHAGDKSPPSPTVWNPGLYVYELIMDELFLWNFICWWHLQEELEEESDTIWNDTKIVIREVSASSDEKSHSFTQMLSITLTIKNQFQISTENYIPSPLSYEHVWRFIEKYLQ
jgi:hypothetical protein